MWMIEARELAHKHKHMHPDKHTLQFIGQAKLAKNQHANMACTRTHAQLWKCILKKIGLFSEIETIIETMT